MNPENENTTQLAVETTALIKLATLHNEKAFKNSSLENMKTHINQIVQALASRILKKTGSEKIDMLTFQELSQSDEVFKALDKALHETNNIYEKTKEALNIQNKIGTLKLHQNKEYPSLTLPLKEAHLDLLKETHTAYLDMMNESLDNYPPGYTPEDEIQNLENYEKAINYVSEDIEAIKNSQKMFLDPDADGLTTGQEIQLGLNPYSRDSDGDGFDDKDELMQETNPMQTTENLDYRIIAKNNQYQIQKKHKILGWKSLKPDKYKSHNLKDLDTVFSELLKKQHNKKQHKI